MHVLNVLSVCMFYLAGDVMTVNSSLTVKS